MILNKLEERLKEHAQITKCTIPAPFNLKTEINKLEENNMIKSNNITWLKRVGTIAAAVAICAITVVSASALNGYFKDVKRFDGAIIGTEYVNATNDIEMNVSKISNENIILNIGFEKSNEAPFSSIQEIEVTEYKIVDLNNKEVFHANTDAENGIKGKVADGKVLIELPIKNAQLNVKGDYLLVIDTIYGLSKAEQPIKITGNWNIKL